MEGSTFFSPDSVCLALTIQADCFCAISWSSAVRGNISSMNISSTRLQYCSTARLTILASVVRKRAFGRRWAI